MDHLIPNSTQIPHVIIREWMPLLKDAELRVLLVIADQTLGWVADPATGRRKTEDWLTNWQIQQKTGKSSVAVSKAINKLVSENLIECRNEKGEILKTNVSRILSGGRIFYRLATSSFIKSLGIKLGKKGAKNPHPRKFLGGKNLNATKLTVSTKLNTENLKKIRHIKQTHPVKSFGK
jgi:hypothetical protein